MGNIIRRPRLPILYGPVRDIQIGPLGTVGEVLEFAEMVSSVQDRFRVW